MTSNLVHCVFSTRDRTDTIPDPPELGRYLGGVAREKKIPLIIAGGTNNHVHLLIALPAAVPLAKAVQELKGNSSRWLNKADLSFTWQEGYAAFSVSKSGIDRVVRYIEQQEEHHRRVTYQEEVRRFLGEHGMERDEHYMWE